MLTLTLTDGWQWKQRAPHCSLLEDFATADGWESATVPGTIHQDLLAAGAIPDPFYGMNELAVQWVGETDWLYRCIFDLSPELLAEPQVILCCDGLDTVATVWLNGEQVLTSDNMFLEHRLSVRPLLRAGRNELFVLFESATRIGQERESQGGRLSDWIGDSHRLYLRKAQYHYGWDWGPRLVTAGIWKPLRLEAYQARLRDAFCPVEVGEDLRSARIAARVEVEAAHSLGPLWIELALTGPDQVVVGTQTLPVGTGSVSAEFAVEFPALWWPHGYGSQPRYQMAVVLRSAERDLDERRVRIGVRRLRLRQDAIEGEAGTSFLFEVNNVPLFCGGTNWIPADLLLPRVTTERYRKHLDAAVQAHMIMIRVWGGGVYEEDAFYDLCDERGLLVWQDFMFACGIYPSTELFQQSVKQEVWQQIRRLRNHPCLALWCGNNENQMVSFALQQTTYHDGQLDYPDRVLYEELLSGLCKELDPARPYWPGSPFGGANPNDPSCGDRHTWEVWHGEMAPYQDYPRFWGRFVSEFGMEAAPALRTLLAITPLEERYPESRTVEHHNKSVGGTRRLAVYLSENLRTPQTLAEYVYATQWIQAEALGTAICGWRRRFGTEGHRSVAGALIWQLNDCWPAISWAIIDYTCQCKPAYYRIARELAPLAVGIARETSGQLSLWITSSLRQECEVQVRIQSWSLDGSMQQENTCIALLRANGTTELDLEMLSLGDPAHILSVQVYGAGAVAARATLWPEPLKYLTFPDPGLRIEYIDNATIHLQVQRPAKGVWLSAHCDVRWSDNMLDLFPGDPRTIVADGLEGAEVQVTWLGASSAHLAKRS